MGFTASHKQIYGKATEKKKKIKNGPSGYFSILTFTLKASLQKVFQISLWYGQLGHG